MTPTLFSWFNSRIAAVYGVTPAAHPAETLQQIGAPVLLANMFGSLVDCEVESKEVAEGEIPDLERREKKRKRSTGQFYTPETLAERLAGMARPVGPDGKILDPACGDGSFLMAAAHHAGESIPSNDSNSHNCELNRHSRGGGNPTSSINKIQGSPLLDANSEMAACLTGQVSFGLSLSRLFGYDIDLQALFVCLTRLICLFPGCGWPVLQHRDFLLEPPEEKFDLIIGNPPYRVNLDETCKKRLDELYQTGEGEKDLYTFFLEGGLRVLRPGGEMIMLTSHTWLVNHQCERIRRHLFEKHHVEAVMLLPARFFAAAPGVLPVVTFVDRFMAEKDYPVRVLSSFSESGGWQSESKACSGIFPSGNGLRQSIVPESLRRAFKGMDSSGVKLGSLCKIGVGIQESFKREGPVSRYVSDTKLSKNHRPVLRGRELEPFKINWEGKYIDYGSHLAYAGDERVFAGPKILYQNIRNEKLKVRLVAALDQGRYFPKNSISYILSESEDYPLPFLLGLLNSLAVNAWFSGQFHSFHVTVTQMRQIPLPPFNARLFAEVASCAEELTRLPSGSGNYENALLKLNEAVCRCYGLPEDRTGLMREFDIFLEQAAGL